MDTHRYLRIASSWLSGQPTLSQNELRSSQNLTLSEYSFDYLMQLAGRFNCSFFKCFIGKLKSWDSKEMVELGLSACTRWLARQHSDWLLSKILKESSRYPLEQNTKWSGHSVVSKIGRCRGIDVFLKYYHDKTDSPQFFFYCQVNIFISFFI